MSCLRMVVLVGCLLLQGVIQANQVWAHPPGEDGDHPDHKHQTPQRENLPAGLVLPAVEGPKPWSDKPILNDPQRFHIAIMTDRTGGHRPGIWMQGVRVVNLMRPQFVVSVGDLIEGYTEDKKELHRQWKEFLGFIQQMEMKFFFVAGNHDLSNPPMHKIWREYFGPEWYSFDYQGVHFVCLSSEDPTSRIGDKQLAWLAKDLEKNAHARWTLVFLHKPLWVYSERALAAGNADTTNWKEVEKLLGRRPHTVFAGHVHHYVQYDRNGMKYYHLGTTGGGSRMRGRPYGEFDQIVWLTMEKEGPRIANILLEGVLPADAVTEKGIARFRGFLAQSRIRIDPILIESGQALSQGVIRIRLTNGFEEEVDLQGGIDGLPLRGLSVENSQIQLQASPSRSIEKQLPFRLAQPVHFRHFARTTFTAKLRTRGANPLSAEVSLPVTIDRRYPCPKLEIAVDGDLRDWSGERFELSQTPITYGAVDQWQGPTDASIRFRVAYDKEHLYLGGEVVDDRVTPQDRLVFGLDARDFQSRIDDHRLGDHSYALEFTPPVGDAKARGFLRPRRGGGRTPVKIASRPSKNGYQFEIAAPINFLHRSQGADWKSFQLSGAIRDIDQPEDGNCYILWRGTRESRLNTNYAHLFRSSEN